MTTDHYFFSIGIHTGGLPNQLHLDAYTRVALCSLTFVVIENRSLDIVDEKTWLFKPYEKDLIYNHRATSYNGLTHQHCKENGVELKEAFHDIIKFCDQFWYANEKHVLVGHNLNHFILDFFLQLFEAHKVDPLDYFAEDYIDTLMLSKLINVGNASHSLHESCFMEQIAMSKNFDLQESARLTAKLWIKYLKKLRV